MQNYIFNDEHVLIKIFVGSCGKSRKKRAEVLGINHESIGKMKSVFVRKAGNKREKTYLILPLGRDGRDKYKN